MSKNFPSHPHGEITPMVVAGGDKSDPSQRRDGSMKVYDPMRWAEQDFNLDDLWFNGYSQMPTQFGQMSTGGGLDPGTIVYVLKQAGEPGGAIIGAASGTRKGSSGGSIGGQNLMNSELMQELSSRKIGVNVPPQIEEKTVRGAKVRMIKEKGDQHSLDMLDGLPIHGALFQMTGFRLPELKQVPTAKQKNDKMMNNQMMQQLQGQVMSMAQMFQGLMKNGRSGTQAAGGIPNTTGPTSPVNNPSTGTQTQVDLSKTGAGLGPDGISYMDELLVTLEPHMQTAVKSLAKLVQGLETTDGVEFPTGGAVHYTIFMENAAGILAQATNIDELMVGMQRLQWDTDLFGQDKLSPVVFEVDTAHGSAFQYMYYDGHIETVYTSNTMNAMNSWANTITSPEYSPGVGSSTPSSSAGAGGTPSSGSGSGSGSGQQLQSMMQQMFGQSAQIMQEMFKRLAPQQEKEAKKMHEKLNRGADAKKLQAIAKDTFEGGSPANKQNYQSDTAIVGTDQFDLQFLE